MGMIEDTRQVIQDFHAPELRAIAVRIDALERRLDGRFDSLETNMNRQFQDLRAALEFDKRLAALESRFSEQPTKAS